MFYLCVCVFFLCVSLVGRRSKARVAVDDNCCLCHVAGVKFLSELNDEDVLHASFRNHVFEVSELAKPTALSIHH